MIFCRLGMVFMPNIEMIVVEGSVGLHVAQPNLQTETKH